MKIRFRIPQFSFLRKGMEKYKNFKSTLKHPELFTNVVLYFICPMILNFVIECMELKSITGAFHFLFTSPYIFMANTLIIIATLSITLLFKKRYFWVTILSAVWLTFGISNFVLLCNRVTPFTACDLFLIESLFDVLHKYFNTFQMVLLGILVAASLVAMIIMFFRAPKLNRKINYPLSILCIIASCLLMAGSIKLGVSLGIMDDQFAELSAAYRKNGFVYCFTNSLIDTGVARPKDYSPESMAEILKDDHTTVKKDTADATPNIIFIQLESFFNIQDLNDVTFSDTVLPNFTKLQETGGGLFTVPVIGAGTVNTEFEVLTGMTMNDFGAGEYPFKTILKETTTESLAYNLKSYGYTAHALHNNTGKFYSRDVVYSNLGFDDFTSVEYMQNYERTVLGWAKDECLTNYIMECMDQTEGYDLVYTISVQGHGGYNVTTDYTKHITVTDISPEKEHLRTQIEYYANMIYEMDEFVGQLIEAITKRGEDTILVMYGDHLPSLDIQKSELDNRTIYQTDYVIWNNCGLKFDNRTISSSEISSYVLSKLGMTNGIINSFRQHHAKDYDFNESLASLEYDMLYGDQIVYRGKNPYKATDMQFGLYPIYVTNIIPAQGDRPIYYIRGTNFTHYSRVYVNGHQEKTRYVDEHTLILERDNALNYADVINVWQSHLTATEDYSYHTLTVQMNEQGLEALEQLKQAEEPET